MSHAAVGQAFYLSWRHPFRDCVVCLDTVPLRALPVRTLRFSAKEPPSETGGLLWGRTITDEDGTSLLIEQVEFFSSEGPLFNANPTDSERLVAALSRGRADLEPMGYFRSDVRGDGTLSEQDENFIEQHLTGPNTIFLIVRPMAKSVCSANIFFWHQQRLQTHSSGTNLPLVPSEAESRSVPTEVEKTALASVGTQIVRTTQSQPEQNLTAANDAETKRALELWPIQPEPVQQKKQYNRILTAIVVVASLVGVSIYLFFATQHYLKNASSASNLAVGLQVNRRVDGQLDLNWNKKLPGLRNTRGATLSILDGAASRVLELTPEQLQWGTLAYFPTSDDIQFHLEIALDRGHSVGESIRVISPGASQSHNPNTLPPLLEGLSSRRAPRAFSRQEEIPLKGSTSAPVPTEPITPMKETQAAKPQDQAPQSSGGGAPAASTAPVDQTTPTNSASGAPTTEAAAVTQSAPPPQAAKDAEVKVVPPVVSTTHLIPAATTEAPAAQSLPPQTVRVEGGQEVSRNTNPVPQVLTASQVAPTNGAGATHSPLGSSLTPIAPPVREQELNTSSRLTFSSEPEPLTKVLPNSRPFGYPLAQDAIEIDVQVRIDEKGRVVDARGTSSDRKRNSLLTDQAILAARRWKFKPAELHGQAIPSSYLIKFHFKGTR